MLIECSECGLQVSDKAYACPHCGNPQNIFPKYQPGKNSRKRLRLPNGFGRITKIKGRVRKPYRAMVTVGKDDQGHPIGKLLKPQAYFDTYNDAYKALLEYNNNPYDFSYNPSVSDVFENWYIKYSKDKSDSRLRNINNAWKRLEALYDKPIREIRNKHIRMTLDNSPRSVRLIIKQLWNMLFDYAIEYELTDRNYARDLKIEKEISSEIKSKNTTHMTYSKEEMEYMWTNKDMLICKLILVQCYSGLRPKELLDMLVENVYVEDHYMIGGSKTEAGRDRIIPIHPLIENIIKDFLEQANKLDTKYLFTIPKGHGTDHHMSYTSLRRRYTSLISEDPFREGHRPHDGRKHFVTQAKKYEVNDIAIKRIVGHSIQSDITESVYTERNIEWYYKEICKIRQY